ncbi:hypothetical protein D9M71_383060 [compost metagenome]
MAGGLEDLDLAQGAVAIDRNQQAQAAVETLAACGIGIVQVADPLDLAPPLLLVPGALVAHGRGGVEAVDARTLGVQLLFVAELCLEAGDLGGQLTAVELRSRLGRLRRARRRCLGAGLVGLRCTAGDGGTGWLRRRAGLRSGWRFDAADLAVLEGRQLGGLRRRLVLQAAAALLVMLGEEVGLRRRFGTLEAGEGDVERLAHHVRFGQGEADPEQQGQMHGCGEEQGETQAIRRAHAGGGGDGGLDGCVHRLAHGRESAQSAAGSGKSP